MRQILAGEVFAAGQTDLLQRVQCIVLGQRFVGQSGGGEQVFERRQFFLDGVEVAEVAEVGAKLVAAFANRLALPANLARFWRQQADQHAQQAGLAGTVTPLQIKQLTRRELEADPGEQASFAAYAFQIVSFEHQKKP